jgi:hypothetical protein
MTATTPEGQAVDDRITAQAEQIDVLQQKVLDGATIISEQKTRIESLEIALADCQASVPTPTPTMMVGAAAPGGTEAQFLTLEAAIDAPLDAVRIFVAASATAQATADAVKAKITPHKGKRHVCLSIALTDAQVKAPATANAHIDAVNVVLGNHDDDIDVTYCHEPFVKVKGGRYTATQWCTALVTWFGRPTPGNVHHGLINTAANYKSAAEIDPYTPANLLALVEWMGADGYDWGTDDRAAKVFGAFVAWCQAKGKAAHITEVGWDSVTGEQAAKVTDTGAFAAANDVRRWYYFHVQDNNAESHTPDKHICKWPLIGAALTALGAEVRK